MDFKQTLKNLYQRSAHAATPKNEAEAAKNRIAAIAEKEGLDVERAMIGEWVEAKKTSYEDALNEWYSWQYCRVSIENCSDKDAIETFLSVFIKRLKGSRSEIIYDNRAHFNASACEMQEFVNVWGKLCGKIGMPFKVKHKDPRTSMFDGIEIDIEIF